MEFPEGGLYKPYGMAVDVDNGYVYVSDTDGFIYRYNMDGTEVEVILDDGSPVLDAPYGLMLMDGKLYWAREDGIGRCDPDGSNAELWLELSLTAPPEMAICLMYNPDNDKVYFTNDKYDYSGGVYRLNPDGTGLEEIVQGTDGGAIIVDTEDDYVFYADWLKGICRNNYDGTDELVIDPDYVDAFVWGMAVDPDAGKVYYADKYDNKIVEANLDGSGKTDLVTDINAHAIALAVTGTSGIDDPEAARIRTYPNPVDETVHVTYPPGSERIAITSMNGQVLSGQKCIDQGGSAIDLSGPGAGVYFFTVYDSAGERTVVKLLKR